jgi:hypothetical protein
MRVFVGEAGLEEVLDVDQLSEIQQLLTGIQKGQLASVTG